MDVAGGAFQNKEILYHPTCLHFFRLLLELAASKPEIRPSILIDRYHSKSLAGAQ
jgi:hypothetical protein